MGYTRRDSSVTDVLVDNSHYQWIFSPSFPPTSPGLSRLIDRSYRNVPLSSDWSFQKWSCKTERQLYSVFLYSTAPFPVDSKVIRARYRLSLEVTNLYHLASISQICLIMTGIALVHLH